MSENLTNHRIPGPPDAFYIPNFVTREEEDYLTRKVCFVNMNSSLLLNVSPQTIDHGVTATEVEMFNESPVCGFQGGFNFR